MKKKIPAKVLMALILVGVCITSALIMYWPFVQALLDTLTVFKFW